MKRCIKRKARVRKGKLVQPKLLFQYRESAKLYNLIATKQKIKGNQFAVYIMHPIHVYIDTTAQNYVDSKKGEITKDMIYGIHDVVASPRNRPDLSHRDRKKS